MRRHKLDDLFEAACDALIESLQDAREEAVKARPALVKGAVELLRFSGHELSFEASPKARQIAEMATHDEGRIIDADFSLPFDGNDQPVEKKGG